MSEWMHEVTLDTRVVRAGEMEKKAIFSSIPHK